MATIDLGKIKQVWRGTYNNGTAYTVDDLVAYTDTVGGLQNTSTYICVTNSTGNAPASAGTVHGSWNLVAQGVPDRLPSQSGQAGKFLTTNGSAVSFGTVESDLNKFAVFKYEHTSGGTFSDYAGVSGMGGNASNHQLNFNFVQDHGNILNNPGSNNFEVNSTGSYMYSCHIALHQAAHYRAPYIYNDSDNKPAEGYNNGSVRTALMSTDIQYAEGDGSSSFQGQMAYLYSGKTYNWRFTNDGGNSSWGTSTARLVPNYDLGNISMYNCVFTAVLQKVSSSS
jgi:hypothetical protein